MTFLARFHYLVQTGRAWLQSKNGNLNTAYIYCLVFLILKKAMHIYTYIHIYTHIYTYVSLLLLFDMYSHPCLGRYLHRIWPHISKYILLLSIYQQITKLYRFEKFDLSGKDSTSDNSVSYPCTHQQILNSETIHAICLTLVYTNTF